MRTDFVNVVEPIPKDAHLVVLHLPLHPEGHAALELSTGLLDEASGPTSHGELELPVVQGGLDGVVHGFVHLDTLGDDDEERQRGGRRHHEGPEGEADVRIVCHRGDKTQQ